jgi:hypothetical protein
MINSFFNAICAANKATVTFKALNYMTDANLAELGHTRATCIENVKNDFIASIEVKTTEKQSHAPVNANLAGAF